MRRQIATVASLVALLTPAVAAAHDIKARVSPSGVEFLEQQLPTYVPTFLQPPAMTVEVADPCPGATAITFTQQNTDVYLTIDDFQLSMPQQGVLRVDLTVSTDAWGEAYIDNPYACFGSATCQDWLGIYGARAVIDFNAWVDELGVPHVSLASVDLQLSEDDINFVLSDCAIDDIVNLVVSFGKSWALDMLLDKVEQMAMDNVGPKLEEMLAGFASYDGSLGSANFTAGLESVDIRTSGLNVGADIDLYSSYSPAACIASFDDGDPATNPAPAPNLEAGPDTHIGVAINVGLVDDALYHIWREGFLCVTPETLSAFGITLDLSMIAGIMPGFPEGTTFTLDATVTAPPRIETSASENATVTLVLDGVEVNLIAVLPDTTTRTLHLSLDVTGTASVLLDPAINALTLEMGAVTIGRMDVMDGFGLEEAGFDFAAVKDMLETSVMPKVIAEFGAMPVTGPIFGGMAGYYVILRELRTTAGWLLSKADLFRAPDDDYTAPDTFIDEQPGRPVRPAEAALLVSGADSQIPAELLRYGVNVDGNPRPTSYVRSFKVGEEGKTATYHVTVVAVDLAGNVDATPAVADVTVDGILPQLTLVDRLTGEVPTAEPTISWIASDDLTPAELIGTEIEIYTIAANRTADLVTEYDLDSGASETTLSLEPGLEYRVIVRVRDEAGNITSKSMLFTVNPDAEDPTPGGCGCVAAGRGTSGAPGAGLASLLLIAAAVLLRRRLRASI